MLGGPWCWWCLLLSRLTMDLVGVMIGIGRIATGAEPRKVALSAMDCDMLGMNVHVILVLRNNSIENMLYS